MIATLNHPKSIEDRGDVIPNKVIIEDDVWISANATILSGVKIGRGVIIAAGAVVNRDVEPLTIVGGIPAKVIGHCD